MLSARVGGLRSAGCTERLARRQQALPFTAAAAVDAFAVNDWLVRRTAWYRSGVRDNTPGGGAPMNAVAQWVLPFPWSRAGD